MLSIDGNCRFGVKGIGPQYVYPCCGLFGEGYGIETYMKTV